MLKKLDWYIIKKYVGSFGFTLGLLVAISISIDVSEKIDSFVEYHLSFFYVATKYYIYFIPYIASLLGPYFVFITVIFFTSQLAYKSEFIAMLSSGISFYRLLVPYLVSAFFIGGILFFANNYGVPWANKRRLAFENKYVNSQVLLSNRHVHRQIDKETYVYMEYYDNADKFALHFSVERIKAGKLVYKIISERGKYDSVKHEWHLFNYIERTIDNDKETLAKGPEKIVPINLDPLQFVQRFTYTEELTSGELQDKITELHNQGADNTTVYELEYFRRTSSAFGVIILTIIGFTIASKKIRGGTGYHLVLGIALCSVFEIIQKFSVTFATNADLPPLIAIWVPNLLFSVLAVFLVYKYQET